MKGFVLLAFMIFGCSHVLGQESHKEFYVGFSVGKATLNPTYGDNATHLAELVSFFENVKKSSAFELVEVVFCGTASPEGGFNLNKGLAEKRRNSLERYVREGVSLSDGIISRKGDVIAWKRLTELVERSDMPYRNEALDILRNTPEKIFNKRGEWVDGRKKQLMDLRGGRAWHYMHRHFFAELRNVSVVLVTMCPKPAVEQIAVEMPTAKLAENPIMPSNVASPIRERTSNEERPFYMALKTNMLYDVLAVPNLGVEFYLGRNWSVGGNWMYGWWKTNRKHRFWRMYGGELTLRKWFGRRAAEKPLTGHHLGVYGEIFTYDFEWGGKGYMGGKPGGSLWDKMNYMAGVEYGYSLPVARRLNIDFTLGVGYWGGTYLTYLPVDGHYVWQATRKRQWIGPAKAEVSLVWLLGKNNSNHKRKGIR